MLFDVTTPDPNSAANYAAGLLGAGNLKFRDLVSFHQDQFRVLWYGANDPDPSDPANFRTNPTPQQIFDAMGVQAGPYLQRAGALVSYLLSLDPTCLTAEQYTVPVPYVINPDGTVTLTMPEPTTTTTTPAP